MVSSAGRPGRRLSFLFNAGRSADVDIPGRRLIFLFDTGCSANVDIPGRPLILDVIQLCSAFAAQVVALFFYSTQVVWPMWTSQVDPLFWM